MGANFTPTLDGYSGQGAFRFWCQKVLPLVYDDSLSYMELLAKVVNYLNNTISDVATAESNIDKLNTAYQELQDYVNEYFDNLDITEEVENIIDNLVIDGTIPEIIDSYIPESVTAWLDENVSPVGSAVIVDNTLSISGAAADAKITGDRLNNIDDIIDYGGISETDPHTPTNGAYATGRAMSNPSVGIGNRWCDKDGFEAIYNLAIELKDSDYNIAFFGFDSSKICIAEARTWFGVGTYSLADMLNDIVIESIEPDDIKYVTFQLKKSNNSVFTLSSFNNVVDVHKNLIIDGDNILNNTISYNKLDDSLKELIDGTLEYDVIMFAGQSNIAGRGNSASAPAYIEGCGYEYRAVSAPNTLSPLSEPFGGAENNSGINDGNSKTGDLVPAFINHYYTNNRKVPVIAISASKGGTTSTNWLPNGTLLNEAISRFNSCMTYLNANNYAIRHKYVVWCQGESDGDESVSIATYKSNTNAIFDALLAAGFDKVFVIRIGNHNQTGSTRYTGIIEAQTEICQEKKNVIMASTDFASMRDRNMMKDDYHYTQAGYNECGEYAGINCAIYAVSEKEPTMYDYENDNLYYSHKN